RVVVVDDDGYIVVTIEYGIADAARQAVVPKAAVPHDGDGPPLAFVVERRGAGRPEPVAHDAVAHIERRQRLEGMAADVGADVQRADLPLQQLHRGEEGTLRTPRAEPRGPWRDYRGEALRRYERYFPDRRAGILPPQLRRPALDELPQSGADGIDRVFPVHRQHVLAE